MQIQAFQKPDTLRFENAIAREIQRAVAVSRESQSVVDVIHIAVARALAKTHGAPYEGRIPMTSVPDLSGTVVHPPTSIEPRQDQVTRHPDFKDDLPALIGGDKKAPFDPKERRRQLARALREDGDRSTAPIPRIYRQGAYNTAPKKAPRPFARGGLYDESDQAPSAIPRVATPKIRESPLPRLGGMHRISNFAEQFVWPISLAIEILVRSTKSMTAYEIITTIGKEEISDRYARLRRFIHAWKAQYGDLSLRVQVGNPTAEALAASHKLDDTDLRILMLLERNDSGDYLRDRLRTFNIIRQMEEDLRGIAALTQVALSGQGFYIEMTEDGYGRCRFQITSGAKKHAKKADSLAVAAMAAVIDVGEKEDEKEGEDVDPSNEELDTVLDID